MKLPTQCTSGSIGKDDYLEQILHLLKEKGYSRAVGNGVNRRFAAG